MNCREFRKKIEDKFGKEDIALSAELSRHLEGCPECSSFYQELLALHQALAHDSLSVLPGELDDITFERIAAVAKRATRKTGFAHNIFSLRWAWVPAAAAAIILAILFTPHFVTKTGTPESRIADSYLAADFNPEDILLSSDSLTDKFLSTMAASPNDLDMAYEELLNNSDIDDMLNSLSDSEMEALYKKLEDMKG